TYRRGLFGIGTGMDHRSLASCSTGGITRARQAASCSVPVTSCPAGIAVILSLHYSFAGFYAIVFRQGQTPRLQACRRTRVTARPVTAPPCAAGSEQPTAVGRQRLLQAQKEPLAVQAARVPGQAPAGADYPMTGHDDADRVPPVGVPDRLRGTGVAKFGRELPVGTGLPVGDLGQQGPDLPLERRAAWREL